MRAFIFLIAIAFVSGDSVDDLCPSVDGDWPVYLPSEDCSKFYECSNGIAHLLHCPDGLQYNAKLNVCDWPESAGCEGSGDNNTTEQPTETTPSDNTTEKSSEESNEDSQGESTEKPSEESNENSKSSEDSNEGQSSDESNDKSKNSEESTEKPSDESNENSKSSEDGKSSEESNDKSSDESSGESDDELIRKACESNEFFLIPHPSDCSKYISCNHGKPYVMPCPNGLNFSTLLHICLPPEQAQCQIN